MKILRNLHDEYERISDEIKSNNFKNDVILPKSFKFYFELFLNSKNREVKYNDFTLYIHDKSSSNTGHDLYIPNQWIYLAAEFTGLYILLEQYKEIIHPLLDNYLKDNPRQLVGAYADKNPKEVVCDVLRNNYQNDNPYKDVKVDDIIKPENANYECVSKMLTDYSWWNGAKNIGRNDFAQSTILNALDVVHDSHGYLFYLLKNVFANSSTRYLLSILRWDTPIDIKNADNEQRMAAYTDFLKKGEYGDTTVYNYVNRWKNQFPTLLKGEYGDIDVFDITDRFKIVHLYNKIKGTQIDKEQNNQISCSLSIYSIFLERNEELYLTHIPEGGNNCNLQQIFYGAPGTGKSYKVKELTGEDNVVRTTFHPDSDYSSFVGCYKPTSIEVPMRDVTGKVIVENGQKVTENRIVYEFVEQAFLKAYIKAWKMYAEDENNPKKQYLVIEEINRGNCAQIFGDLFQLLDRGDNGFSEYPIDADKDMQKHLAKAFQDMAYLEAPAIGEMSAEETARAIRNGEKLILPSNLYIWATMNTSDQSLFPIDSAFKRRWDWQYVPIHDGGKEWQIEADGKRYDWWQFVDAMNDKIGAATYSEDKKLGYFFCKAKDGVIDAETFVGKVVFYIWNDVFKDFAEEAGNLFKDVDGSMLSFNKFYTIGTDGKRMVVEPKIAILMQNLGVEPITTSNSTNDDEPEEDEDGNNPSSYNKNYDKFSVNGEGKWGKNRLPYECLKKYVEMNPGLNADEVLNNWKNLNVNVPHFVESKEEYESRTDNSKRSYYVKCGDTIIYVAHNGYGSNGKVYEFIDAINNANWGIKLAKVMA